MKIYVDEMPNGCKNCCLCTYDIKANMAQCSLPISIISEINDNGEKV